MWFIRIQYFISMHKRHIPVITYNRGTITSPRVHGFELVPDLVRNKSRDNGFNLNILVMGRRGLGTTTFLNNLFQAKIVEPERPDDLTIYRSQLLENDICLTLGLATYHGSDPSKPIEFINECNAEYFEHENIHENSFPDPRIHLCLYLLPTDKVFSEELNVLKNVSQYCNVLPVIAKADTFTAPELKIYREKMKILLADAGISHFQPPEYHEDAEFAKEIGDLQSRHPLAIYASDTEFENDGKIRKGRLYSWGFLDIDDEEHNDFLRVRRLLISNHLDDLISSTEANYYDAYRKKTLESDTAATNPSSKKLSRIKQEMEKILTERNNTIISKMEEEILKLEQEFNAKKGRIILNNERNNLFSKL